MSLAVTYRGLHGARVCAWWRGYGWVPSLLFTFVLACSVKKKKNIIIETLGQAHKLTRPQSPPRTHAGDVKHVKCVNPAPVAAFRIITSFVKVISWGVEIICISTNTYK